MCVCLTHTSSHAHTQNEKVRLDAWDTFGNTVVHLAVSRESPLLGRLVAAIAERSDEAAHWFVYRGLSAPPNVEQASLGELLGHGHTVTAAESTETADRLAAKQREKAGCVRMKRHHSAEDTNGGEPSTMCTNVAGVTPYVDLVNADGESAMDIACRILCPAAIATLCAAGGGCVELCACLVVAARDVCCVSLGCGCGCMLRVMPGCGCVCILSEIARFGLRLWVASCGVAAVLFALNVAHYTHLS